MMAIENYPLRRRGTRNQAIKVLHPLQMMPNVVIYSDPPRHVDAQYHLPADLGVKICGLWRIFDSKCEAGNSC